MTTQKNLRAISNLILAEHSCRSTFLSLGVVERSETKPDRIPLHPASREALHRRAHDHGRHRGIAPDAAHGVHRAPDGDGVC